MKSPTGTLTLISSHLTAWGFHTAIFQGNYVWTRMENVDRTDELLLGGSPEPPGFSERYFARVQAYTAGYEREVGHIPHLSTALGAQFTWYGVPDVLKPTYGEHPVGGIVFLRIRPH